MDGNADLAEPAGCRTYLFASTQHGAGSLPVTDRRPTGERARYGINTVDYTPLLRSALANLDAWVSEGREPPPSQYPRLDDGTAVAPATALATLAATGAIALPDYVPAWRRVDWGESAAKGIASVIPPRMGAEYPHFVSAVDADGNETAGIRLPDVSVPLATHISWNLRHPDIGASGEFLDLTGSTVPFAATRAERFARGDKRRSIEERYASKGDYLAHVRAAAIGLAGAGYLLREDVEGVVAGAGERWDAFAALAGVK